MAVLVIALIGTIGFGLVKVALLGGQVSGSNDSSIKAYHAAESGLEYALLQYRLNKNEQIDQTTQKIADEQSFTVTMTHDVNYIGAAGCFDNAANTYAEFVACDTDFTNPLAELMPDQTVTFETKESAHNIYLRAAAADNVGSYTNSQTDASRGVLQVEYFNITPDSQQKVGSTVYFYLGLDADGHNLLKQGSQSAITSPGNFNKVAITYWHNSQSTPLKLAVKFNGTSRTARLVPFDSGVVTVLSTGTSGGVNRRLAARIDRQTDKVLGIFDFAVNTNDVLTP